MTGASRPFNRDRYASDRREVVGAELRRCAATDRRSAVGERRDAGPHRPARRAPDRLRPAMGRRGSVSVEADGVPWRPDRRRPLAPGRAGRGQLVLAGRTGAPACERRRPGTCDSPPARRAPGSLRWDCSPGTCYAYPLLVWLLRPAPAGRRLPVPVRPVVAAPGRPITALARWASLRIGLRVETQMPRADVASALYHAPGSIGRSAGAVGDVSGHRCRSTPTRPLVWAALLLTLVAAIWACSRHRARGDGVPGGGRGEPGHARCLLWAFAIRSLASGTGPHQLSDPHATRRTPRRTAPGRTVDGSPGGVAVRGRFDAGLDRSGDRGDGRDDARRRRGGGCSGGHRRPASSIGATGLLGVELHPGPGDARRLGRATAAVGGRARQLTDGPRDHRRPLSGPTAGSQSFDRIVIGSDHRRLGDRAHGARGWSCWGSVPWSCAAARWSRPTGGRRRVRRPDPCLELRRGDVVSLDYFPEIGEG